jgi:hypothetical protein
MSAAKTGMIVRTPGEALLHDLLAAVAEELEDGSIRAELGGTESRRQELGRRWRGTTVFARVADGSPVSIIKEGLSEPVDDGEGHHHYEPVEFNGAVGRVKEMTPAYGGYIVLTDKMNVCLPHLTKGQSLPAVNELGLDIEVLDLGRREA